MACSSQRQPSVMQALCRDLQSLATCFAEAIVGATESARCWYLLPWMKFRGLIEYNLATQVPRQLRSRPFLDITHIVRQCMKMYYTYMRKL